MKKALLTFSCLYLVSTIAIAECVFHKPVQITELQVGNLISWSTLTEHGNRLFVIEKSIDGTSFEDIGEVEGSGDSVELNEYRFLDTRTGVANAYYRLRMVDKNDYESLTHTFFYTRESSNNYICTSMSTPFTSKFFSLTIDSKIGGELQYRLENQKKEILLFNNGIIDKGMQVISINLEPFPLGTYKLITSLNEEDEEVVIKKVHPKKQPRIEYVIK